MVWKPKIGKLETSPIYCFHSDQISLTYSVYKSRYLVIHVRTNTKNNEHESLHLFHATVLIEFRMQELLQKLHK